MNRDEFIHMAGEAGENFFQVWPLPQAWEDFLERFGKLVAAAEREACAEILDANAEACVMNSTVQQVLRSNAKAIRARGQE